MHLLGDPHLGRAFINGVPLARRGERERKVLTQFQADIMAPKGPLHVCMGDLFDKAVVPYRLILDTANAYAHAALKNRRTQYVILKGNHDWQRDLENPSAFDLFSRLVGRVDNITTVTSIWRTDTNLFFAWHPTQPASEYFGEGVTHWKDHTAFGHWDIEDYGGDNTNLIPTKEMAEAGITRAYTGHIHKPQQFSRDGVDVTVVGSMQPYAHGEEINDDLYQTVTKKQFLSAPAGAFRNKCLRIDLKPGETLDEEVDCLQLTIRKEQEGEVAPVTLGDFDMGKLFKESFKEAGVSEKTTAAMMERYEAGKWSA